MYLLCFSGSSSSNTNSSSASFSAASDVTFKTDSDSSDSTNSTKEPKPGLMSSFSSFRFSPSFSLYDLVNPKSVPKDKDITTRMTKGGSSPLNKSTNPISNRENRRVSAMVPQRHAGVADHRKVVRRSSHAPQGRMHAGKLYIFASFYRPYVVLDKMFINCFRVETVFLLLRT